jgi:hypothetical protein
LAIRNLIANGAHRSSEKLVENLRAFPLNKNLSNETTFSKIHLTGQYLYGSIPPCSGKCDANPKDLKLISPDFGAHVSSLKSAIVAGIHIIDIFYEDMDQRPYVQCYVRSSKLVRAP